MKKLVEEVQAYLDADHYHVETTIVNENYVTLKVSDSGDGYVIAVFTGDDLKISQRSTFEIFADQTYERLGIEHIHGAVNSYAVYQRIVANIYAARIIAHKHRRRFGDTDAVWLSERMGLSLALHKILEMDEPEPPYRHISFVGKGITAYFTMGRGGVTIEITTTAEGAEVIARALKGMDDG